MPKKIIPRRFDVQTHLESKRHLQYNELDDGWMERRLEQSRPEPDCHVANDFSIHVNATSNELGTFYHTFCCFPGVEAVLSGIAC